MYEIYALIAAILLPTGIGVLLYFLYQLKTIIKHLDLWPIVFENVTLVILGIFYIYSAVILSQKGEITKVEENIWDDFAIVNDTMFNSNEEDYLSDDRNNEVEDSRKNTKPSASLFLEKYQALVQEAISQKFPNKLRKERNLLSNILDYARNFKEGENIDIVENQNCFLNSFLFEALLVYSFITSVLSLLNKCHICQRCPEDNSHLTPKGLEIKSTTSKSPSDSFGEKIADDSLESIENGVKIRPLFDSDSIKSHAPGFEVFAVKTGTAGDAEKKKECKKQNSFLNREAMRVAAKCSFMFILPIMLILLMFFLMRNNITHNHFIENVSMDPLQDFNLIPHNVEANFNEENSTTYSEINNIVGKVYMVLNKIQESHKAYPKKKSIVSGLDMAIHQNQTEQCVLDNPYIKTFDFVVLVVVFFLVILYTKIKEPTLLKDVSTQGLNKSLLSFLVMWAPSIVDTVLSKFITLKEPNMMSAIMLLLGNLEKIYSTKKEVDIFKMYSRRYAFVVPAEEKCKQKEKENE
ncbi:uncharacterized protein LOC126750160 [Anthonomus grandis grandis]|uniref:uncharacterized protein LOC126750160 n=1 Tax=Anthonomus grandis grandis TaxID=2921223 RepID=UPI0021666CE9|nr:uncharacterized protein LOC126750160 [Anthonomus grandis grandis]